MLPQAAGSCDYTQVTPWLFNMREFSKCYYPDEDISRWRVTLGQLIDYEAGFEARLLCPPFFLRGVRSCV